MSDNQTIHDPNAMLSAMRTSSAMRPAHPPCPHAPTGPLPPGVRADPASQEEWRMEREALLNDPEASPDDAEALPDDRGAWREERRDACALLIGEAVRPAAVVDAMGLERIVRGVPAERALGERLVRLYDGLGQHAGAGDGAAAMVRDRLAPLVLRLQAAALDEAVGHVRALVGANGIDERGPGGIRTSDGPRSGDVR